MQKLKRPGNTDTKSYVFTELCKNLGNYGYVLSLVRSWMNSLDVNIGSDPKDRVENVGRRLLSLHIILYSFYFFKFVAFLLRKRTVVWD